jgi:outer membrane lipoprotein-sorting protein
MKFLRTISTGRLLALIVGLVVAVGGVTAMAVAATSGGPVPKPERLAKALHSGLTAPPVKGITADVNFTNNLISSADFTGEGSNPILQGATGRLWMSGNRFRLELQSDSGDAQVVVNNGSFFISDPSSNTVYKGTLPADSSSSHKAKAADSGVPTIAQIQSELNHLVQHFTLGGAATANPTDVGGRPAYSVSISPKHDGGLLGSLQLAWDAVKGVPLKIAIYSRTSSTPVLALKLTNISYGTVSRSVFAIHPLAGANVVTVATPQSNPTGPAAAKKGHGKRADISGVAAVSRHVPFALVAPRSLVGLPRQGVTLLNWGGKPAALATYGQGLGGMAVIEQRADGASASTSQSSGSGLSLPTVSIHGSTGQELSTALGTMIRFTRNGVAYTVIGSVAPYAAEQAARGLTS